MENTALKRLVPTDAAALAMVRVGVCGFMLCEILLTSFSDLGRLPSTLLRPTGGMQILSWRFYDRLLTPAGMLTFKWLMVLSLFAATIGWITSLTTKSSALLFVFYEGLLRSFAHFNHDEMPAVYILFVLAFTPCGDAFSIDSWRTRKSPRRSGIAYGYPILLMRMLLAWSYFSSALIKLRVSGLSYLSPDNLPALAIVHSLDNLHDTHHRLAFWLPHVRQYTPIVVALMLLWELLFPLAIFFRRARLIILTVGVFFHLGTLFFMNIFFPYHLAMYLVFVDWGRLRQRVEAFRRRSVAKDRVIGATHLLFRDTNSLRPWRINSLATWTFLVSRASLAVMNQTMIRRGLALLRQGARKTASHPRDALLSARMALWVVLISLLAELISLPRAQRIVSFRVRSNSPKNGSATPARLGRVIDGLLGINLFVFRRSCWKRAMVLHRYCNLNGIKSQIKFGLRKDSNGKVEGHAWLEHDGHPLLEDNAANYVVTFSLPVEHSASGQSANYPRVFSAASEEGIAK